MALEAAALAGDYVLTHRGRGGDPCTYAFAVGREKGCAWGDVFSPAVPKAIFFRSRELFMLFVTLKMFVISAIKKVIGKKAALCSSCGTTTMGCACDASCNSCNQLPI